MFVGPANPSLLSLKHTKMSTKRGPRNSALVLYSQAKHNPQFLYFKVVFVKIYKISFKRGPEWRSGVMFSGKTLPLETSVLETLNGGQFISIISSVDKTKLSFIN